MNINAAIAALDGSEYPNIGSRDIFAQMKEAGLVAVFGHSDDCMEFRGALDDEFYDTVLVTERGFVVNKCDEGDDCPNWKPPANARTIKPVFDGEGEPATWVFKTDIQHRMFKVMEDGEVFQHGIVFALADAATPTQEQ